uniref:Uncharacterized protein n=1 Tax=Panagrolaimus davidi TaxID=227884 RepID=A0A914PE43_9BILA
MSEYYNIPFLKEECEEFLSFMDITVENIEFLVDFAHKYSFKSFSAKLGEFFRYNFYDIVSSDEFIHYKKPFVRILSYCEKAGSAEEELVFAKVCFFFLFYKHKFSYVYGFFKSPPNAINLVSLDAQ